MKNVKQVELDPLYVIFEQHLFNFQDPNADRKKFINGIVKEYITRMRSLGLLVPSELESHIVEELSFQVNTMLVKKIYGCLTINEFTDKKTAQADPVYELQKKRAKKKYRELDKRVKVASRRVA
jgi:hypothetical protein